MLTEISLLWYSFKCTNIRRNAVLTALVSLKKSKEVYNQIHMEQKANGIKTYNIVESVHQAVRLNRGLCGCCLPCAGSEVFVTLLSSSAVRWLKSHTLSLCSSYWESLFIQWTLRSFDLHFERKYNLCVQSASVLSSLTFSIREVQLVTVTIVNTNSSTSTLIAWQYSPTRWAFWWPRICLCLFLY